MILCRFEKSYTSRIPVYICMIYIFLHQNKLFKTHALPSAALFLCQTCRVSAMTSTLSTPWKGSWPRSLGPRILGTATIRFLDPKTCLKMLDSSWFAGFFFGFTDKITGFGGWIHIFWHRKRPSRHPNTCSTDKVLAEVSKIGNYRRRELFWCMDGRANPLMDRKGVEALSLSQSLSLSLSLSVTFSLCLFISPSVYLSLYLSRVA